MKKFIFCLMICTATQLCLAQTIEWRVNFSKTLIKVSETDFNYFTEIEYTIEKLVTNASDIDIELDVSDANDILKNQAINSEDFNFNTVTIELKDAKYTSGIIVTEKNNFEVLSDREEEDIEIVYLEIDDSDSKVESIKGFMSIEIKDSKIEFNPDNPFRVSIGTNFDFLNNIKADNLYSEVTFNHKNLFNFKSLFKSGCKLKWTNPKCTGNKIKRTVGLSAGYYQNRNISEPIKSEDIINYISFNDNNASDDSISVIFNNAIINETFQFENLGLYVAPTFELFNHKENDESFAIHLGLYLEVIRRKKTTTFTSNTTQLDTTSTILQADLIELLGQNFPPPEMNQSSVSETLYDRIYGITLPIFYENNFVEYYLRFSTGPASLGFERDDDSLYYVTQFRIVEKKLGFQLLGDFRGQWKNDENNNIAISVSKIFYLDKLLGL